MSERLRDEELERTLSDIGDRLAYPSDTRIAQAVRARIAARPRSRWSGMLRLAPVGVTLALLLLVTALALPGATAAAREFLRLRGIDVFPVPSVPALTQRPSPSTPATQPSLAPGERVTLAQAQARVRFTVRVPAALGAPDEVYVDPSEHVTMVYRQLPGIPASAASGVAALLVEFRGTVDASYLGKAVGPDTKLEQTSVDGAPAYWLEGAPHFFFYRAEDGSVRQETLRLAGNTLIWVRDGVTLRLEAQVSKSDAVAVASSLR